MMHEARSYLNFAVKAYRLQYAAGRVFLHEHPASAKSWGEAEMEKLMRLPGVHKGSLDMCRYGLTQIGEEGEGPVKKETCIISNSKIMVEHLSRRCLGDHMHVQLKGGTRTSRAAIYSPMFCEEIVSGYKKHKESMKSRWKKEK